jgi:hypothetical protein
MYPACPATERDGRIGIRHPIRLGPAERDRRGLPKFHYFRTRRDSWTVADPPCRGHAHLIQIKDAREPGNLEARNSGTICLPRLWLFS